MTTIARLDPLCGIAAFLCALAVFLATALDGPDAVAVPVTTAAVGSTR
jgi:hypothetical protein